MQCVPVCREPQRACHPRFLVSYKLFFKLSLASAYSYPLLYLVSHQKGIATDNHYVFVESRGWISNELGHISPKSLVAHLGEQYLVLVKVCLTKFSWVNILPLLCWGSLFMYRLLLDVIFGLQNSSALVTTRDPTLLNGNITAPNGTFASILLVLSECVIVICLSLILFRSLRFFRC